MIKERNKGLEVLPQIPVLNKKEKVFLAANILLNSISMIHFLDLADFKTRKLNII